MLKRLFDSAIRLVYMHAVRIAAPACELPELREKIPYSYGLYHRHGEDL